MKRIAFVTDLHLEEEYPIERGADGKRNFLRILQDIKEKGIENLVFGGDIGTTASNKWFFEQLSKSSLSYKLILGNHDTFEAATQYFELPQPNNLSALCYVEDDQYHRYIYMDTSTDAVSEAQLDWLKAQIETNKPIVLFIHHPVLQTGTAPQKTYPLSGSDGVRELLLNLKQEVYIFCGHLHMPDERSEENVMQYITPSSAIQLKKESPEVEVAGIHFGYRIIEIEKKHISTELVMFDTE